MTALRRKLLRDLWQMKGQALAICLVMACGVATFVMSLNVLESLKRTQDAYYDRYRFADVFTHLKRAPNSLAERIADVPSVSRVQTRIVQHVALDVEGLAEPAVGRLISVPERSTPTLNALYLRSGRQIEYGRTGEVLVSEAFAAAHGLQPGDRVRAVINGKMQHLHIVGVALSPEFIYQIREGDLMPDDRRFGVFWMGYTDLAAAFDMQGAFNDVTLSLMPGASEPEVLRRLDELTEPYGGLGAYGRTDQSSHKFISNELNELRGMSMVVPTIFLAVAAFLLQVVLSRLVTTQREQIATLKAFGYTRWEIAWHYFQMVGVLVVLGVCLGTLVGAWLGREVTEMYVQFFHFPVFAFHLDLRIVLLAFGVSALAAFLGTLNAVRRAVRLPPAEAMRPEPPATYRPTVVERLGLQRLFSPLARMILRHLERQPLRASLTSLGVALAVAVLILGSFGMDALDFVLESEFQFAQRQDLTLTFIEPSSSRVLGEIRHLPGVGHCESFRGLAVRLRNGHRSRRVGILGLEPDAQLFRIVDIKRRVIDVPEEGLALSEKLGELLGVGVGDSVTVEVLEGKRPTREIHVAALVSDFQGMSAYMSLPAAQRLMAEGHTISGAFLAVDPVQLDRLYATLKGTPRVAGVTLKGAALRTLQETIAENILRMRTFNIIFAGIIAFGVVYNAARISLAERSRELATLRVMGFTRGEISFILLGELAILTLTAIPAGLLLGYGLAASVIWLAYDTELFRIPLIIDWSTYAFAATVTLIIAVLSAVLVGRGLARLDLVAVLKSKE